MCLAIRIFFTALVFLPSLGQADEPSMEIKQTEYDWASVLKSVGTNQMEGQIDGALLIHSVVMSDPILFARTLSHEIKMELLNFHEQYKVDKLKQKLKHDPVLANSMAALAKAIKTTEQCFWSQAYNLNSDGLKLIYKLTQWQTDRFKTIHPGFVIVGDEVKEDSRGLEHDRVKSLRLFNNAGSFEPSISVQSWKRIKCEKQLCFAKVDDIPESVKSQISDQPNQPKLRWCFKGGYEKRAVKSGTTAKGKPTFDDFILPKSVRLEIWDQPKMTLLWSSEK